MVEEPVDTARIYIPAESDALYEEAPLSPGGFVRAAARNRHLPYQREALVKALIDYNQQIGNDFAAKDAALTLLQPDVQAVVTGQQPGFMGGPCYTILKAISALSIARRYDAPAIFWIASEDHDLDEAASTLSVDEAGNLKKYRLDHLIRGVALEDIRLGERGFEIVEAFLKEMRVPFELPANPSYSGTIATFLSRLFKGTGLIFIEPKYLKTLCTPFFKKEITETEHVRALFQKEKDSLAPLGGDLPFPKEGETSLFLRSDSGKRERIHWVENRFSAGGRKISEEELVAIAEKDPARISSSVMSRPVMAAQVIPTAAAVLGPGELNYFLGLKNYFRFHGVSMPWLVPRISSTFIFREDAELLKGHGVDPVKFIQFRGRGQEQIAMLKESGISGKAINRIQNLLTPHGKMQERVLNWFTFQSKYSGNLLMDLLDKLDPEDMRHRLLYI
ncbi:bacillithiol biosynthesis protein BshC [Estrella lausannensis]|uniref:Cysteine ligase BshC n=1 Tax=Estrella lausannensis TaxID=483423 RepID=A0A0H5DRN9_9BACT|nr:bacillithiol biosynthesis BshC [Estrella lausannensis]CRX38379.1 hypothetical protein ELAC_1034 [Estrella lausannensis]